VAARGSGSRCNILNISRWSKFDPLYDVIGDGVKIFLSLKHNCSSSFPISLPNSWVPPRHVIVSSPPPNHRSLGDGTTTPNPPRTARPPEAPGPQPRSAVGGMDPSPGPHRGAAVPGSSAGQGRRRARRAGRTPRA
jgi:hypothetical protein